MQKICESARDDNDANGGLVVPASSFVRDLRACIDGAFCDVVFAVGEREIGAHRGILAFRCDFFAKLLTGQLRFVFVVDFFVVCFLKIGKYKQFSRVKRTTRSVERV